MSFERWIDQESGYQYLSEEEISDLFNEFEELLAADDPQTYARMREIADTLNADSNVYFCAPGNPRWRAKED